MDIKKRTADTIEKARKSWFELAVMGALTALMSGGIGVTAHNAADGGHQRALADLQRDFDRHIAEEHRSHDRQAQALRELRRDIAVAIRFGDGSFLGALAPAGPASAFEAEEAEDGDIDDAGENEEAPPE